MSQPAFAQEFGFNLATLRGYEQGRRDPDTTSRTLLTIISMAPDIVRAAVQRTK